jgi:hypothetical protein
MVQTVDEVSAQKCFAADADHGLNVPMNPTLRADQSAAARPASKGKTVPVM